MSSNGVTPENPKAATNPKATTNPKANPKPKLPAQLKQLVSLLKDILSEKDLESLDQIISEKKSLQQQLEARSSELEKKNAKISSLQTDHSQEIAKYKSRNNALSIEFGELYKVWNGNTYHRENMEGKVQKLQEDLKKAKQDCDSQKEKLNLAEIEIDEKSADERVILTKLTSLQAGFDAQQRELTGAVTQLKDMRVELHDTRRKLRLEDVDIRDLNIKFDDLVKMCHDLAMQFFRVPLPKDQTSDLLWPKLQQSGFNKVGHKKIPISSSKASQHLRMAAAESVIGSHLCTEIFQQYYLPVPNSSSGKEVLDDVLKRLYEQDPEAEAIFRAHLIFAYRKEEDDQTSKLIDDTKSKISKILLPLLFTQETQEGFQTKLRSLLVEVVKLWKQIQRSELKGRVDNEPGPYWGEQIEYDQGYELVRDDEAQASEEAEAVMSLFPHISIGENTVCQGYALWSTQKSVIAATTEYAQITPSSPTRRRANSFAYRGAVEGEGTGRRPPSGVSRLSGDYASFSTRVQKREQQSERQTLPRQ